MRSNERMQPCGHVWPETGLPIILGMVIKQSLSHLANSQPGETVSWVCCVGSQDRSSGFLQISGFM